MNLKLTRPYMRGPAVKRLQELGDSIGIDEGKNDGVFGPATKRVVLRIQERFGLKKDGVCGPKTWGALTGHVDEQSGPTLGRTLIDIRGTHPPARLYKCKRDWSTIDGVTIHQTGCWMSQNPRGWHRLNAHIGITQSCQVVYVNDATDWIWHAQKLSKHTIGLEFDGNFPGIQGNEKTLWKGGGPAASVSDEMLKASDELFDFLVGEFKRNGQPWTRIHAHRQSSDMRRADPGSEIWQKIAMVWAERLGLEHYDLGSTFCYSKGKPIPREWNSSYHTKY